ncbi:hypothetical protein B1B_18424, partial [mine drainage metagenome]
HLPALGLCQHVPNLVRGNARASIERAYRAALGRLDSSLTALFGARSRHGYLEDTADLLVSDHGQSLGEHGFYGHGYYLFDELVRIPGCLWDFRGGCPGPRPTSPRSVGPPASLVRPGCLDRFPRVSRWTEPLGGGAGEVRIGPLGSGHDPPTSRGVQTPRGPRRALPS